MHRWSFRFGVVLLMVGTAQAFSHPIVPGFERFHAKAPDSKGGQLLLGELGCVSCHQATTKLNQKVAPILDQVGSRVRVSYLRKFLSDPQAVKPGTTMPNLFTGDPNKKDKIEALVHFLATKGNLRQEPPRGTSVPAGRELYHQVGCVACHGSRDAHGKPATLSSSSVPLGDLTAKYSIHSLRTFLENPHSVRPSGRMPKLLNSNEARDVANYLLQGLKVDLANVRGATRYAYYEGNWSKLPDFDKLKPLAKGFTIGFDINIARRQDNFAFKFDGVFEVRTEGEYRFSTISDDGSRLYIDGKLVVDNDGGTAPQGKNGTIKLTKGIHDVTLTFFEKGGGAEVRAFVRSPGRRRTRNLADLVSPSRDALVKENKPEEKPKDPDYLKINNDLVEKGRKLFTSIGCASCHQMREGNAQLTSSLMAPELGKLKGGQGCLAGTGKAGVPWFGLSDAQKKALTASLGKIVVAESPKEVLAQTMTTLNCYACHSRDKVGGPLEELNKLFQTTQPEMGDEARIPPPLDGVGAKMKTDYLRHLLTNGVNDRPYMHTRMPGFGSANAEPLIQALQKLDTIAKAPEVKFKQTAGRIKAVGRHLIGDKAFSCMKCHTFAGNKAEGVQGIDMTLMTQRLRHDWFHAYVSNPQAIRPGTRMPAAFVDGMSLLPKVLDGTANQQIEAMWRYLSDGTKAQLPSGTRKGGIPLIPKDTAIIYRNFIQGAGPRAIAVGYPEQAHLAWNANEMRLALIWQGAFIDAARHWTNRGVGYEGPLGDNVLTLHGGQPFAVLTKKDDAWPKTEPKKMGYRFRGYQLTPDDRPTFLYELPEVQVEEFPTAVGDIQPQLKRTFTLKSKGGLEDLYFRAAVGNKIEKVKDGEYRIDGAWRMKLEGGEPILRTSEGKTELLVPIRFKNKTAKLVQTIIW